MSDERTTELATGTRDAGDAPPSYRVLVMWEGRSLGVDLPDAGELRVGRAKDCDVVVEHGSVSRSHLAIQVAGRVSVRDLGSQNGTRINGRPLGRDETAPIHAGTVVQIGAAVILLQARAKDAPAPFEPLDDAPLPALPDRVLPADGAMHQAYRLVAHVAKSRLSVLFLGETGAGKEIVCEALHRWSPRSERPLVRLNCAALPEQLLESELFGFERGAFTGAAQAKQGLIETAHGGTLFLDEIGEMPLATQAKLLRVLEAREVLRIGALAPRPVDVRLVAATHRDLESAIQSGTFRSDLYYRLNGVSIAIPPLRARTGEIEALAATVARRACEESGRPPVPLSAETLALLRVHAWPGNVRELRNVIERAVALATGDRIEPRHLLEPSLARPARAPAPAVPPASPAGSLSEEVSDLEKKRILDALERSGGNQSKAATELGMPRRTLVRRLRAYGLTKPRGR